MGTRLNYKESIRHFFMLYALIPLVILMIAVLGVIMIMPRQIVKANTNQNIRILSERITVLQNNCKEFVLELAASEELLTYLETGVGLELVNAIFYKYNHNSQVSGNFHIMDQDGNILHSSKALEPRSEQYLRIALRPRLEQSLGEVLFEYNKIHYQKSYPNSLTVAISVEREEELLGYLILQLSSDDLGYLLQLNDNDIVILTDRFGNVIYTNYKNADALGLKFIPQGNTGRRLTMDQSAFYYSSFISRDHNLNLYTLSLINSQPSLYGIIIITIVFFGLFLFLLLQSLANRMVVQNSHSIDNLMNAIGQLHAGDHNLELEIENHDEFQMLADQYKNLADQIETLLKNNEELARLKRNSEVKVLEAQFSPHFILNILETLRYSLYTDLDVSHQIINMLSNQLKYSLYNLQENQILLDELSHVEEYIKLHQIRFDSRISYTIEIEEKLKHIVVPKLIIQPIIENSIKYGFRYQDELNILIRITDQENKVQINITDDGKGLKEKEFLAVKELLLAGTWPDNHIGLYSINKRLVLLYGEEYHIEVVNREGETFTVILHLPLVLED